MAREPNIPLFLWVAAAILTHLTWGGGADEAAQLFEERADVRRFAASVDRQVRQRFATEIALLDDAPAEPDQARDDADSPSGKPDDKATKPPPPNKDEKKKPREELEKDKPPPVPEKELKKTPPKEQPKPQQKPEAQKEKKPKPEPEEEKKPVPLPQPQADNRRVAVVQHVDNPNQPDNPNAQYIADQANKVQQETQAHVTATDQDNAKPTPGSQYHGPTDNPGDSHVSDVAQSDDSPGELNKAPSEDKAAGAKSNISVSQPAGIPQVAARIHGGPAKADPGEQGRAARLAMSAQEAVQQTEQGSASSWQMDQERDARLARAAEEARRHRPAAASGNPDRPLDFLGLGAPGQTELGVNLNLTPGTALAAIGQDQLQREIVADGERRRSKHQGSWKAIGIERWRPAIENY
ncbi:MAG TPA: hypothetical protein VG963_28920, partial [Polyangiaceae bacterium]|nr:hypothetical protein [Polyangiaceae bacterium]